MRQFSAARLARIRAGTAALSIGLFIGFGLLADVASGLEPMYQLTLISSNFNGTPIAAGNWIWFNANFKYDGATPVTIAVENATVSFTANGIGYVLPVPDARIDLDPSVSSPTIEFDEGLNTWFTDVPASFGDDIFLTGLAWHVPVNLPGGINPVVFTAEIGATNVPATVQWKWGAAVYTSFSDNYDLLDVQPVHATLHAGTPLKYIAFVIGGARGGGGSNYTGSWSATQTLTFVSPVSVDATSWGTLKTLYR